MSGYAGLPPFVFGTRAWVDQLVCPLRTYVRANDGARDLLAPMLAWSAGPPAIGDTGDNSPGHMTGTTWLLQVCPTGDWVLYRESSGQLEVMPFDDPPDPVTSTARHVSLAFDQASRVVLTWEDQGIIKVRRWDASSNQYVQNVSFAGVDPVVFMDATVVDPTISPDEVIRRAAELGWGVTYEWSPTGQWLDNVLVDSDVLIFYLSADRTELRARVQRELYQQQRVLWTFSQPVILDRVVALFGHYQILLSDATGTPLPTVVLSDVYILDAIPVYGEVDPIAADLEPENLIAIGELYNANAEEDLAGGLVLENLAVVGALLSITPTAPIAASLSPENLVAVSNIYNGTVGDDLAAALPPEAIIARVDTVPITSYDNLTGGMTVENIRVQAV